MADNHSKKDGGPAFPQSDTLIEDGAMLVKTAHGGMTLRDWFAGQVLVSVSAQTIRAFYDDGRSVEEAVGALVGMAFRIADAMIAARGDQ